MLRIDTRFYCWKKDLVQAKNEHAYTAMTSLCFQQVFNWCVHWKKHTNKCNLLYSIHWNLMTNYKNMKPLLQMLKVKNRYKNTSVITLVKAWQRSCTLSCWRLQKTHCDRLWGGRKSDLFGSGFKKLNPAGKTDVIKATNLWFWGRLEQEAKLETVRILEGGGLATREEGEWFWTRFFRRSFFLEHAAA